MKKNCYNCKHCEYFIDTDTDGYESNVGYTCHKRDMDDLRLENNMMRDSYLEKAKVCCDLSSENALDTRSKI